MEVSIIAFRKNKKEVYLHVLCNELMNPIPAIKVVIGLYNKMKLGKPSFATEEPNWMHSIPLPGGNLNQAENTKNKIVVFQGRGFKWD